MDIPYPPADLRSSKLLVEENPPATWFRIAWDRYDPLFYNRSGDMRFDSESAKWGVCYLASDADCAMAEVFGETIFEQNPPYLRESDLARRRIYRTTLPAGATNFCPLYGSNLMHMKATMECFNTNDRSVSQVWAKELMLHPQEFQGLTYKSNRGGDTCLALFGEARVPQLDFEDLGAVIDNPDCLRFLTRNRVGTF